MPTLPATAAAPAARPETRALRASILGSGACVPDAAITNADLEALVSTSDAWIVERTGIRERRRVAPGETPDVLAARAARTALERAGGATPDGLIVATCSPQSPVPPIACLVQRELGLAGIPAFDVNAACSGYVYALALADSLVATGRSRRLLIIGVDALTPLVDYRDRATCVLFGDAAGASLVGAVRDGGIVAVDWGADGRGAGLIFHGPRPDEPGSPAALRMAGKGTYRLAVEHMCAAAHRLAGLAGWTPDEVDVLIPHQANLRIIESAAGRLGIPMERVVVNIDRYGNTSAGSIPLALAEADASGRLREGERVMLLAFGAGVTWGGVAMEWTGNRG
jgi:3-oxoacyl-[acyl-carrier-protein] synthase-3